MPREPMELPIPIPRKWARKCSPLATGLRCAVQGRKQSDQHVARDARHQHSRSLVFVLVACVTPLRVAGLAGLGPHFSPPALYRSRSVQCYMFKFDFYSASAEEEPVVLANATKVLTAEDDLPARHHVARKIQPGDGVGESSLLPCDLRLLSFSARVEFMSLVPVSSTNTTPYFRCDLKRTGNTPGYQSLLVRI